MFALDPATFGLAFVLASSAPVNAAQLKADEAYNHIGEAATICDEVAAARNAPQLRGEPMLLRLGQAASDQAVTVVILDENRAPYGIPTAMLGRHVCVSGVIERFRGKPRMVVETRSQFAD